MYSSISKEEDVWEANFTFFVHSDSLSRKKPCWALKMFLMFWQRSGRHTAGPGSHLRKNHESFSMQADKKEKTRHNHFIKTAQPYKPKVTLQLDRGTKTNMTSIGPYLLLHLITSPATLPFFVHVAGVRHWAEQKEKQRRDRGHRWPGDAAVSLSFQWAAGVGRADEEAENVSLFLAARRRKHGKGTGGLQALPFYGLWGQKEWRGGRHLGGA